MTVDHVLISRLDISNRLPSVLCIQVNKISVVQGLSIFLLKSEVHRANVNAILIAYVVTVYAYDVCTATFVKLVWVYVARASVVYVLSGCNPERSVTLNPMKRSIEKRLPFLRKFFRRYA